MAYKIVFLPAPMHTPARRLSFFSLVLLLFVAACSPYEKVLKSNDVNLKLTKANEYYDQKKWSRANELYRGIAPVLKGTRNYEPLYLRYAYTFYNMKQYMEAAYHFKNFTDFFPASKDAEEAEYMHAVSLYKDSPKATLEQTTTIKAMEALRSFINMHPNSARVAEARQYLETAREKLEKKEANVARLYYNLRQYRAAAFYYRQVLEEYPMSPNADYYQLMVVKSLYFYAKASIESKQQERYADVAAAYTELKDIFPKSSLIGEAEQYAVLANTQIEKSKAQQ